MGMAGDTAAVTTLFGDDPAAKKKRTPKAKPEADGRVVMLEAGFVARHEARWGVKPLLTPYGKNRRHLKDLAGQLPDDELLALMDLFFSTRDRDVERSDYTIGAFVRLVPHLRLLERRTGAPRGRTADNLDAAARATGRRTK